MNFKRNVYHRWFRLTAIGTILLLTFSAVSAKKGGGKGKPGRGPADPVFVKAGFDTIEVFDLDGLNMTTVFAGGLTGNGSRPTWIPGTDSIVFKNTFNGLNELIKLDISVDSDGNVEAGTPEIVHTAPYFITTPSLWAAQQVGSDLDPSGTGQIQSGVIEVHSDLGAGSEIQGTEVFEILGNFVSVTNSPLRTSQQVYVSFTSDENTGLAICNPDPENSLDLNLILVDHKGEEQTRRQITVGSGKQVVQFVDQDELFKDFFQQNPGDFHGTLNVHAQNGMKAAVLGLLQKRFNGALIAVATSPSAFGAEK